MLWSELRLIFKTSSVTPDFFLRFLSNFIIFYRQSKFSKNLCVGSFWARTSLNTVHAIKMHLIQFLGLTELTIKYGLGDFDI